MDDNQKPSTADESWTQSARYVRKGEVLVVDGQSYPEGTEVSDEIYDAGEVLNAETGEVVRPKLSV